MVLFPKNRAKLAFTIAAALLISAACMHVNLISEVQSPVYAQASTSPIYSDHANAKEDIRQALVKARIEHKRVLLDFGGNWCPDCHLLNLYFHDPGNASLLATNYILVDVNVGEYDRNLDLARRYQIPLKRGVPALAVLDGSGQLVYSQRNGEFEAMSKLESSDVTAFLLKWRPPQKRVHSQQHPE